VLATAPVGFFPEWFTLATHEVTTILLTSAGQNSNMRAIENKSLIYT